MASAVSEQAFFRGEANAFSHLPHPFSHAFGIWEILKDSVLFMVGKSLVKGGIEGVEILAVQMVLGDADGVGNTVNMK